MKRRQPAQQELRPVVERVVLERRELKAYRKHFSHDQRTRGGWDPLELRLGLRASLRSSRPGYIVSNPPYHETLLRVGAELDDSLPGRAWLRTVYRHWNEWPHVTLPGVRAVLKARYDEHERAIGLGWGRHARPAEQPAPADAGAQMELL